MTATAKPFVLQELIASADAFFAAARVRKWVVPSDEEEAGQRGDEGDRGPGGGDGSSDGDGVLAVHGLYSWVVWIRWTHGRLRRAST